MENISAEENKQLEYENKKLEGFLKYPNESKEVDYKNSEQLSKDNVFSYKLIKHIIGFANSGGGYIVIGYKENNKKIPEPDLEISDNIVNSYDVSTLAEMVESFIGAHNKIDLNIYKIENPENKKIYPIIKIRGFNKNPFFCVKDYIDKTTNHFILKKNSLYIRIASARTIELATPDEWEKLIDQAVIKKQDELLFRFKILLKDVGLISQNEKKIDKKFVDEKDFDNKKNIERYNGFIDEIKKDYGYEKNIPGFIINHRIIDKHVWKKDQLIEAMESSKQKNTGFPIGTMYRYGSKEFMPEPLIDCIKLKISSSFDDTYDFWKLYDDGNFLFFRNFEEDSSTQGKEKRVLWFDTRIWRIIESIKHMVSLYKNLVVEPTEKIVFEIRHSGIENRELASGNQRRLMWSHNTTKSITEVLWSKEATIDEFMINSEEYAKECARDLFLMFDYWKPEELVLDSVIEEYNKSWVG